jgi:lactate dehydrogenase-like 2-hydroxyacid dehydrogenase
MQTQTSAANNSASIGKHRMSNVEILQVGAYPEWDQGPLDAAFTAHRYFEAADKAPFLAKVGPRIRAIATRGDLGANAAMIAACPRLEVIAVYGVGYDAVDIAACKARGIRVTNTPDVLTDDCADLGVAMMLSLSRGITRAEDWVRDGSWAAKGMYPLQTRVSGKKAGILGLGRIGMAVARRLAGFDMDIAYCAPGPKPDAAHLTYLPDPVALAAHSDFLFVTLSASAATRHIVNAAVIKAVGPQGMLINISRAANIDEESLLDALETGALGSAALDVFEGEPKLNPRFLALKNVLLQPHHASGTYETRKAMGALVRENLLAHFAGRALITPVT